MLDRERVLAKLDQLDGYLQELRHVVPGSFSEYLGSLEKRRDCERLSQIATECMMDSCALFVSGLRLGLPGEEDELLQKLEQAAIVSPQVGAMLRAMKEFRNILVHQYGSVDDTIVYKVATTRVQDFETFRSEMAHALREKGRMTSGPGGRIGSTPITTHCRTLMRRPEQGGA